MKKQYYLLLCVMLLFSVTHAQQKYAILIAGNPTFEKDVVVPEGERWNDGLDENDEFWNDVYLFWEMLIERYGFSDDNVTVFFGQEDDYQRNGNIDQRYDASVVHPDWAPVTFEKQTTANIQNFFNQFSPSSEDIVFLWVLCHGWAETTPTGTQSYIWCTDGKLYDDELAGYINALDVYKKIVLFQSCKAYGFVDDFTNSSNTIVITAASIGDPPDNIWEQGHRCDNYAIEYQSSPWIENEVRPSGDYHHAEFDYHFFCANNGSSPNFETFYYNNEPFSAADLDSDNFISIGEAFAWANNHESMKNGSPYNMGTEHPYMEDNDNIAYLTSFEYPTLLCQDITPNMGGLTIRGQIGISNEVHISGVTLHVLESSNIFFINDYAKLVIEEDANLIVNGNSKFYGNSTNRIDIKGTASFNGTGISIECMEPDGDFGGLYFDNPAGDFALSNATFRNSDLHNESHSLTLQNCHFIGCDTISSESGNISLSYSQFESCGLFQSALGDIEISQTAFTECGPVLIFNDKASVSHSSFIKTGIYLENPHGNDQSEANIFSNTFSNTNGTEKPAIELYSVPKFNIHHNYISSGFSNGIQLSYSGIGALESQLCRSNLISGCTNSGIHNLNSNLIIQNNHIYSNEYGVRLFGKSIVHLLGDGTAALNTQTQEIINNSGYEVYASLNSFPPCFMYNIIQDPTNMGNPTDPLLYHSTQPGTPDAYLFITNNCWNSDFDPEYDLFPSSEFYYLPYWCPNGNPQPSNDPPQDLYNLAGNQFNDSSYFSAKSTYKLLVDLYHESRYAQSAMIDLLRLERFADNDFLALKEYYLGNDTIVNDSTLAYLGLSLANDCDIFLENYQDAIDFYEAIIQNPYCAEDSILAIVDLGHLYYLMEQDSLKAGFIGSLPQYKPNTQKEYFQNRDYLLSLLPIDPETKYVKESLKKEACGKLIQNIPNPVNGITTIWYRIEKTCTVSLLITDIAGRQIKTYYIGSQNRGNQKTDVNLQGMTPGVYFYSLIVDRTISDTRKLTVIN